MLLSPLAQVKLSKAIQENLMKLYKMVEITEKKFCPK